MFLSSFTKTTSWSSPGPPRNTPPTSVWYPELLAIHAALTEWRHWLEGAQHPILDRPQELNIYPECQEAGSETGSLGLAGSTLPSPNRPGSKNVRADALSRLFPTETLNRSPAMDTILPPARVVGVVTWGVESAVRMAQRAQPDPGGGPRNCLFIPTTVRSQVLQWGHASRLSCHPGATRTAEFIRQRFWWPTLEADARSLWPPATSAPAARPPHHPPASLLRPLPIPGRPWSDIALDFVTGLPTSKGNNTIMTMANRFSKMVHFVALPKLSWNGGPACNLCGPVAWYPPEPRLWPWSPVHVRGVAGLLLGHWGHGQLIIRIPSPDQQAGGAG